MPPSHLIDDVAHADSVDGKQSATIALVDERKREVAADLGDDFVATLDPGRDDGLTEGVDRLASGASITPHRVALNRHMNRARLENRGGSCGPNGGDAEPGADRGRARPGIAPREAPLHRVDDLLGAAARVTVPAADTRHGALR